MEASTAQFSTSEFGDAELSYGDFSSTANTGTICTLARRAAGWWVDGPDSEMCLHVIDDFGRLVRKPRGCFSITA